MFPYDDLLFEEKDFFKIVKLRKFRQTPGVSFELLPTRFIENVHSIDRVIHESDAISPHAVEGVERPWYMHPYQDDNLLVLHGIRDVDIYQRDYKQKINFRITPYQVYKEGELIYDGPAMLVWNRGVFHRIQSGDEGSASINFAIHHEGFDIKTNFNIYYVYEDSGEFQLLREGKVDQF